VSCNVELVQHTTAFDGSGHLWIDDGLQKGLRPRLRSDDHEQLMDEETVIACNSDGGCGFT